MNNLACDIIWENEDLVKSTHNQALLHSFSTIDSDFCFKNYDFCFINCFKIMLSTESISVKDRKTLIDLTLNPLNSGKTFLMPHEDAQRVKAFNPIRSRSSNEIENLEDPTRTVSS